MDYIDALVTGRCATPFDFLGIHPQTTDDSPGRVVRAFFPWARTVQVLRGADATPMNRRHDDGVFEASFPDETEFFSYRFAVTDSGGTRIDVDDAYRFLPSLDEEDLESLLDGSERRAHRILGAQHAVFDDIAGTRFAVWAPHAHNVNLMGEFNRWDGRCHPMRPTGSTGVWELFVPGIGHRAHYKYEIRTRKPERRVEKADPYGRFMEVRPQTASLVWTPSESHSWRDGSWMTGRVAGNACDVAMSIYEVHLGSWRRKSDADPSQERQGWLSYRELADELLPYVLEQGFTHVELVPVAEHPLDKSWGYQTVGYFAPTSRFGTPDDFCYFVDRAHNLGLGVLVDWTPAHFPRDAHGLAQFDGTPLYEYGDPRRGAHPDWGTLIFDYGRPQVRSFLVSNAIYWLEELHVDGLRVDAVASMLYLDYSREDGAWIPNRLGGREHLEAIDFIKQLNDAVHEECPGALVIAEESTSWPKVSHPTSDGGLGFDLKWNMGWMNDTLEFFSSDPLFRKGVYGKLTFSIWYAGSERFLLPLSHDEVVHLKGSLLRKMPGAADEKLANLRLLLAYMWAHPGKKLLFMGGEFGQPEEWNFEGELNWDVASQPGHAGVQQLVRRLNELYREEAGLHDQDLDPNGFEWLECHDAARTTLAFIRWAHEWTRPVIVAVNLTPVSWAGYRLPVPFGGSYRVLLNTASDEFGSLSDHMLPESFEAVEGQYHGREHYLEFDFPPLTALYLSHVV